MISYCADPSHPAIGTNSNECPLCGKKTERFKRIPDSMPVKLKENRASRRRKNKEVVHERN